ncbi:hypothetical protein M406DRAFT_320874 [Cryphonectria parasitica EP155]|uniref:Uncharacterized protein n=1 Tax=Cryphonectria parasitica (strain ATCC 38755 / EP155) TaxID=660469 RepID=A0A9P5CSS9_CRYP1|nr:uncharacterized protein M406DRAFT_320874 [Cryphonectria parasitica EP155]KAF3768440.1 hypothetical protein M406DRAFT_320874 [Cryphonectria parasitica EP155]
MEFRTETRTYISPAGSMHRDTRKMWNDSSSYYQRGGGVQRPHDRSSRAGKGRKRKEKKRKNSWLSEAIDRGWLAIVGPVTHLASHKASFT